MLVDRCTWDDDYKAVTQKIRRQLLELAHVSEDDYTAVLMQGSGTFGVESVLTSVVGGQDKVLICSNGAYGKRMTDICTHSRIPFLHYAQDYDKVPDAAHMAQLLAQDSSITHVAMVHSETTSGILNDIQSVGKVVRDAGRTFIVDAMSSFGGVDIRQLATADLRSRVGFLPQEVILFYGTVRDNIALGDPTINDHLILRASAISGVADMVKRHPSGYGAQVGEQGRNLSGGQRQAVGLARALVRDPDVLILDEPTSNMDVDSERLVQQRLAPILGDKTLILITHRLSMLRIVDRLIVMDAGRVLMDGPRDAVLARLQEGRSARRARSGETKDPREGGPSAAAEVRKEKAAQPEKADSVAQGRLSRNISLKPGPVKVAAVRQGAAETCPSLDKTGQSTPGNGKNAG